MNEILPAVRPSYDPDEAQIALIKQQFGIETPHELQLFLHHARKTGLDPLARQIYAIMRNQKVRNEAGKWVWTKKMTIQMSIDGFRLIAERSGHYAGQLGPQWCGEDGIWKDIWLKKEFPSAARVAILRDDFKEPLWSVARLDAYMPVKTDDQGQNPQPTGLWGRMAPEMLAKCAEALSLRRGFPMELAGYYTDDEMRQADEPETKQIQAPIAQADVMQVEGSRYPTKASGGMDPKPEPQQASAPAQEAVRDQAPAQVKTTASQFDNAAFPPDQRLTLPEMAALEAEAKEAASFGSYAFSQFWSRVGKEVKGPTKRKYINGTMAVTLREKMDEADERMQKQGTDPATGETDAEFIGGDVA